MANFSVSPGVTTSEIDNTFLIGQPVQAGAAIIGPTVKGPVEIPTLVTSYSDYVNKFGDILISGSDTYSYFTSISAYNYFNNGGTSLIVARIVSSSTAYTPATSSIIADESAYVVNGYVTPNYVTTGSGIDVFVLETISEGIIMNSNSPVVSGSYTSGSKDNVRFQITNPSTSSGAFNLIIRRGDDSDLSPAILETWNGVNLDPNSPRFISKVIGDQILGYNSTSNQIEITSGSYPNKSRYVRVKQVNSVTPNYFDNNGNPKPQYTASLPAAMNGAFGSAIGNIIGGANFYDNISTQTQGVTAASYANMVNLLSNKDDYQFNILSTPGLTNDNHTSVISTIISNTQLRGDNIYIADMTDSSGVLADAISQASSRDNSYAATYWPWVRIQDPATGKQVYIPASTLIPGVFAFNDKVAAPWFAPAGINRGGLSTVLAAKTKLSQSDRDELYAANVNPIATFPKSGISVFGQKTLQKGSSSLDRINVRRLLIELKSYITQIADTLVFEQNTISTRNNFLARVNPYLTSIQQKQGLYAFKVVMDESNNTPDVIDRNQLIGQIYIQPSRTAEFIALDFILTPTGAQF
jgi:phage tail sheath protein FI